MGRSVRTSEMTLRHREIIIQRCSEEGKKARELKKPQVVNPYGVSTMMERCAWNAGWCDEEDRCKKRPPKSERNL